MVAVLEATGELFNNKVKRHVSVSVEDAWSVYNSLCCGLWWHWFNAIKWYYFTADSSEQESSYTHCSSLSFHLADLFKPAFRHIAKIVELHQEHQSVTWGLHFHILGDSGKTGILSVTADLNPNPVQDFVWYLLALINWYAVPILCLNYVHTL